MKFFSSKTSLVLFAAAALCSFQSCAAVATEVRKTEPAETIPSTTNQYVRRNLQKASKAPKGGGSFKEPKAPKGSTKAVVPKAPKGGGEFKEPKAPKATKAPKGS